MHINDIDGEELGKFLNDVHINFYGNSNSKANLFEGGNVGQAILGLAIVEASKNIKKGLIELANAIEKL
jgi:hypothetical protein